MKVVRLPLIALAIAPAVPSLQAKTETTRVKIVSNNVTQQIANKHRHEQLGVNLNAVIGGEQVLLMCTDRSKCEALKPGDYTATLPGKKVEIHFTEPVTKKREGGTLRYQRVLGASQTSPTFFDSNF